MIVSARVCTAAHPLAAWFFVPHPRDLFTRPPLQAIVCLLGIAWGLAYGIAKSIWPSVILHRLTGLAWKFVLGGPFIPLGR